MKNMMISTALMALAGTASFAQDSAFRTQADPMELHASQFIGKRVYTSEASLDGDTSEGIQDNWKDNGEINAVVL